MGLDQEIAFKTSDESNPIIRVPLGFLLVSTLVAFGVYYLGYRLALVHYLGIWTVVILFFVNMVSIMEAIIRTIEDRVMNQVTVLCGLNLSLVLISMFKVSPPLTLVLAQLVVICIYIRLIYASNVKIRFTRSFSHRIGLTGLVHSFHGLINQNYIIYFIVRFCAYANLPAILTIIRILNLSTWPLQHHVFAQIGEKAKNRSSFFNSGLGFIARYLSLSSLLAVVAFLFITHRMGLFPVAAALAIGILFFANFGVGLYMPLKHKNYRIVLGLQIIAILTTMILALAGVITPLLVASIFSLYLITCSLSYLFPL